VKRPEHGLGDAADLRDARRYPHTLVTRHRPTWPPLPPPGNMNMKIKFITFLYAAHGANARRLKIRGDPTIAIDFHFQQ
jgi:hypothetical protein